MAIETAYVCDRCDHKQKTPAKMWKVGIVVNHIGHVQVSSPRSSQLWCDDCTNKFSLTPKPFSAFPDEGPKPPTLEDIIREIVFETVSEEIEERS